VRITIILSMRATIVDFAIRFPANVLDLTCLV
jgi:hypothetical protein